MWNFKERLVDLGLVEPIFSLFLKELEHLNLILNEGRIIDASFIEMPRQRNFREENQQIKAGEIPSEFVNHPHKLAQKDMGARWTKKHNANFYGYKNHIKIDGKSKIITKYCVTDASVRDSQALDLLLDNTDEGKNLHAYSAYTGKNQEILISKHKMNDKVHANGCKNAPLTENRKAFNTGKSRIGARVEHIFGFMENSIHSMTLDCIGIKRAAAAVGMLNLVYNRVYLDKIIRLSRPLANFAA